MPAELPTDASEARFSPQLGDTTQIFFPVNLVYLPESVVTTNPKTGEQKDHALYPFNPALTGGVVGLLDAFIADANQVLGDRVGTVAYERPQRTKTFDLQVGVPEAALKGHAVILGYSGGLLRQNLEDTHTEINALTDPNFGIEGDTVVSYMYFEGRDDRPHPQSRTPDQLSKDVRLTRAASQRPLAGVTVWDPHSTATVDKIKHMYEDQELPVVPLTAVRLFADRFRQEGFVDETTVVLSPDLGAIERAQAFAQELNVPLVFAHKTRPNVNESEIEGYYKINMDGSIEAIDPEKYFPGITVLAIDDMGDTVGTQKKSLGKIKSDYHAGRVGSAFTHAIFNLPEAEANLQEAMTTGAIDLLLVTDSLPSHGNVQHENIKVISLAEPTASLVKVIAGVGSEADRALVEKCRYFPTKNKLELLAEFNNGNISTNGHLQEGASNIVFFRPQQQVA